MGNQPRTSHPIVTYFYRSRVPGSALILSAILILAASGTVQSQQSGRLVEEVEVVGNRRLVREDILKQVHTRPGEPYSSKRVERDLQSLLALGWFVKSNTRVFKEDGPRGGVIVVFEVQELPLILDVTFEGLYEIKESELIDALSHEGIKAAKDSIHDPVKIRKAMQTIRKFFASRGWPDTDISVRQERDSGSYVSVTFTISRVARF